MKFKDNKKFILKKKYKNYYKINYKMNNNLNLFKINKS